MGLFGSIGKFVGHIFNEAVETVEDVIHGDAQIIKEVEKVAKVVAPVAGGVAALFPATAPFAIPAMVAGTGLQAYSGNALKDVIGTGLTTAGTYSIGSAIGTGIGKIGGIGGKTMTFADFTPSGISKMLNSGTSPSTFLGKATSSLTDILSPAFSLAETGVKTLGSVLQSQAYPSYYGSGGGRETGISLADHLMLTKPTYGQLTGQSYPSSYPFSREVAIPEEQKDNEKNMFLYIGIAIAAFGLIAVVVK